MKVIKFMSQCFAFNKKRKIEIIYGPKIQHDHEYGSF